MFYLHLVGGLLIIRLMHISSTSKILAATWVLLTIITGLLARQWGWSDNPTLIVFLITFVAFVVPIFFDNKKDEKF